MPRPALVKLGGSLLTDKARPEAFRRGAATRLMGELARARVPLVLLHGAGSFGHPIVARSGIGEGPLDAARQAAVSETLASLAVLSARVLEAAQAAGLRPVPVPVQAHARYGADGSLEGLPCAEVRSLLDEGWMPVLHGTLVRAPRVGWKVLSADRILAELAAELHPRLALFASDVDGVLDGGAVMPKVSPQHMPAASHEAAGAGADVTGRMGGKLEQAFAAAQACPTLIVNGNVRGRLLEALRGGHVVGTRVEAG